jgi:multiple sugar transport system substrate-binding protein
VAQTAVLEAPKQLHSHLRGALNAGASFGQIEGVLSIVNPLLSFDQWKKVKELWRGVREGWIPAEALTYKEEESKQAFQDGHLLFLRNWPYAYAVASAKGSRVAGKIGAVPLPGPDGPGTSVLGGSNLAVNTRARHPESAARLIAYLTSAPVQRQVLTRGALPPVRAALYEDPGLIRRFPYLPTLRESVINAKPRPKSPRYDQVSLVVQAVVHDAMTGHETPAAAARRLARELSAIPGR